MVAQPPKDAMKREFILAGSIFVAMAIVGAVFALWFVFNYAPARPAPMATAR